MFEYRENDNLDYVAIEQYMKMPMEELERLIEEKEREVREQLKKLEQ